MANILIVDDDRKMVDQIGARLQGNGHACRGESNGERALEIVEQGGVQMLVLDVMIPGLSGFELCRRVRMNPKNLAMPIMLVSAMDGEEEIAHGLAQGADDFVSKPFNIDQLVRRVENLLTLNASISKRDDLTSLPAARWIKHELQTAVQERRSFSLIYAELMRTAEFGRAVGNDDRLRAIRHYARGLSLCNEQLKLEHFSVGHLGSGHFLCILDAARGEEYARAFMKLWDKHMPRFYSDVGHEAAYLQARTQSGNGRETAIPLLETILCVTSHDATSQRTNVELLETLTNIRKGAMDGAGAGIYLDRRGETAQLRG